MDETDTDFVPEIDTETVQPPAWHYAEAERLLKLAEDLVMVGTLSALPRAHALAHVAAVHAQLASVPGHVVLSLPVADDDEDDLRA